MKNLFFISYSLLLSSCIFGQDTTRVVNHFRDGKVYDTYLRNSNSEKEGAYIQYSRFGKKYIVGQYQNGEPKGVWNYYSSDTSGVLVQTLNFDSHTEFFVDSNKVTSLICGPRFFGGRMAQNEYIAHHIQNEFSNEEKTVYKGQVFVLSFSVDPKTLKVVGVTVDDPTIPDLFEKKLLKIAFDMPTWLPPVCKEKSEVWRFSVAVVF